MTVDRSTVAGYYRHQMADRGYTELLFRAGAPLQSAELNALQLGLDERFERFGRALFKDGDVVDGCSIAVDPATGATSVEAGRIYAKGRVIPVGRGEFVLPAGSVQVGLRLTETIATELDDPTMRNPAEGTRTQGQPGAARVKVVAAWGWSGALAEGDDFYPVYSVDDRIVRAVAAPPSLDAVNQALARYDYEANGSYAVEGLRVAAIGTIGGRQVFSLSEGVANVQGFKVTKPSAVRVSFDVDPDLATITDEPHAYTGPGAQRIVLNQAPIDAITAVEITTEKTVVVTRGAVAGGMDLLPDDAVLLLVEVKQGGTTFVSGTDYKLTGARVDWSLSGAEPAAGSSYNVKYRYYTTAAPTAVDEDGFSVDGAVPGTLVQVTYRWRMPRIDRLALALDGSVKRIRGLSDRELPTPPAVPIGLLPLATVEQRWRTGRLPAVSNDGVRVVSMADIEQVRRALSDLYRLVADERLKSNATARAPTATKGLFVDNFLDDDLRDAGIAQTAVCMRGTLRLSTTTSAHALSTGEAFSLLPGVGETVLEQKILTGSMKINPYQAFEPLALLMSVEPAVDYWRDLRTMRVPAIEIGVEGANVGSVVSVVTETVGRDVQVAATARQITVAVRITNCGVGERLETLAIGGVEVTPAPKPVADAAGLLATAFTIPANLPAGAHSIAALMQSGRYAAAAYRSEGEIVTERLRDTVTRVTYTYSPPPPPTPERLPPDPAPTRTDPFVPASEHSLLAGSPGPGYAWQPQVVDLAGTVTTPAGWVRYDPLAQTFSLTEGRHLDAVDIKVMTVGAGAIRMQIRDTVRGEPGETVLAESELPAGAIAANAGWTSFPFAGLWLAAGTEYAIVLMTDNADHAVAIAEVGKFDAAAQAWVSGQPYTIGLLFSSSNAAAWTPHHDRDLTFRLRARRFTATARTIALGTVAVANASDLLPVADLRRTSPATQATFVLTLPGGAVLRLAPGQPAQLASRVTGNVAVALELVGDATHSPIVWRDCALMVGDQAATGTYVSRVFEARAGGTVNLSFEAYLTGAATLAVEVKDGGWQAMVQTAAVAVGDGWVRYEYQRTAFASATAQLRLSLAGTAADRPAVRSLSAYSV